MVKDYLFKKPGQNTTPNFSVNYDKKLLYKSNKKINPQKPTRNSVSNKLLIGPSNVSPKQTFSKKSDIGSKNNFNAVSAEPYISLSLRANFLYKANAGDTFSIDLRLGFGSVYMYWGDGIIEELIPNGYGFGNSQTFSHTYQKDGEYPVQLFYDSNELETLAVLDDKNFFAHTGDFPTQTLSLRTRNTNTYGDIKYFPDTWFSYRIEHEPNVFGDIKGWKNRPAVWYYGNGTNIGGNLSSLMSGGVLRFDGTELEGNLNIIAEKGSQNLFWFNNIKSAFYTKATYQVDVSGAWIRMDNNNLSSSEVDQALIDLSNSGSTGDGFHGRFYIGGSNAPRTAASDAAVNDLQSKNWSISVNT